MAEQLRTTSASSHLKNRQIFKGSQTTTWAVPEGTTEVWVHVWGGGGGSVGNLAPQPYCVSSGSGGGGGGYSRAIYSVTDSDTLSITVGGNGGTSSVTVPTQTPGSPMSATGGSSASDRCTGGTGGTGSVTLNPTFSTYYCFTASGGSAPNQSESQNEFGGGGAAGSPLGPGGNGGPGNISSYGAWSTGSGCSGSGGGIGGSNGAITMASLVTCCTTCSACSFVNAGGSAIQQNAQIQTGISGCTTMCPYTGIMFAPNIPQGALLGSVGNFETRVINYIDRYPAPPVPSPVVCTDINTGQYSFNTTSGTDWFYVEDILGSSGYISPLLPNLTNSIPIGDGAGGAGGRCFDNCSSTNGGFLGGGGAMNGTCYPGPSCGPLSGSVSSGGCAGGSGGTCYPVPGTPGVVIIYW